MRQNSCISQTYTNKLIINADDFGYCEERDRGIIQLLQSGSLSSVTVMINGPHVKTYLSTLLDLRAQAIQAHPLSFSLGLHFNITEFAAVCGEECDELVKEGGFRGKDFLYQACQWSKECLNFVKQELRAQIERFIDVVGFRPSHVDGHNHIHLIPQVAECICEVCPKYGIYKVRMVGGEAEKATSKQLNQYNSIFLKNGKQSQNIYHQHLFTYPSQFIGLDTMGQGLTVQHIKTKLRRIKKGISQLMVHPGYKEQKGICAFSCSKDREKQMQVLGSFQFKEGVRGCGFSLSTFYEVGVGYSNRCRILLFSKMALGCGNLTTAMRIKEMLHALGYDVYFLNSMDKIKHEEEVLYLREMIKSLKINLIMGMNIKRTGGIIYDAMYQKDQILYRIPYILILGGTDVNVSFVHESQREYFAPSIRTAHGIISLAAFMKKQMELYYPNINITLIRQSNLSPHPSPHQIPLKRPYIIFPTSFRAVKAVGSFLPELNEIIEKYEMHVYIVGPILDRECYDKLKDELKKVEYLGTFSREVYLEMLKNSYLLINTSQSQGMSCSVLEAMENRIIVLARNNPGNAELISHGYNGFLFDNGLELLSIFQQIHLNYHQLQKSITEKAYSEYCSSHSPEQQIQQYGRVVENVLASVRKKYHSQLYSFSGVHPISDVNLSIFSDLKLYPWPQELNTGIKILDIGCGNGVFSFTYWLLKNDQSRCKKICFSDISLDALSNLYTNLYHFVPFSPDEVSILESDMFDNEALKNGKYDLIFANLPQTPFQLDTSRPDKNGGTDGFKYHRALLNTWGKISTPHSRLIVLYSHMCPIKKYHCLLSENNCQIEWSGQPRPHIISLTQFDKMEQGLGQHLISLQKEEKIGASLRQENLIIPAQLLIIKKK